MDGIIVWLENSWLPHAIRISFQFSFLKATILLSGKPGGMVGGWFHTRHIQFACSLMLPCFWDLRPFGNFNRGVMHCLRDSEP